MKKKDKKQTVGQAVSAVIDAYRKTGPDTDPDGMYTGIVHDTGACPTCPEKPVQDADDL